MACNCGKNRKTRQTPTPTGSRKIPDGPTQAPQPSSKANSSVTKAAQSFELRTTTGKTSTFGSRLEARAARKRAGGGTITPR